jgi:hypothetical protein
MSVSAICPFQNHHNTIPYSAGGDEKLAAASLVKGTAICCHGLSAAAAQKARRRVAMSGRMT